MTALVDTAPPWADERAGTVMRAIAVFGLIVAVLAPIGAWRFLNVLERDLDRSLAIGEEAAATLTETIDVADDVVAALDDGLDTLDRTLATVDVTVTDTASLASTTAELAARLPETFDDVDAALATVQSLSSTIDGALRAASAIPLGPDYDPAVPLPTAVGGLRDAFEPIGADLAAIAAELDGFGSSSSDLRNRLDEVRADVTATRIALENSDRLLDRYRAAAGDAGELASSSRADLGRSIWWARAATILGGLMVAVAQYVPWWLGTRLRCAAS